MKSAAIILNPASGREAASDLVGKIYQTLGETYQKVHIFQTSLDYSARYFADLACQMEIDLLVSLGGDGTVNQVVHSLLSHDTRPVYAPLPFGTVNNFSRMLGYANNEDQAIDQLSQAQADQVDVGRVNDGYFISTISAGSIPESAKNVSAEKKAQLGHFAYLIEGAQAIRQEDLMTYRLLIDDQEVLEEDYSLIVVGLANAVYGIPTFFKDAEVDDGYLHILGLKETSIFEKLGTVGDLMTANIEESENVDIIKFKKLEIQCLDEEDLETTVDGDDGPRFPLSIEILPAALEVLKVKKH